jgi:hypothetical protein
MFGLINFANIREKQQSKECSDAKSQACLGVYVTYMYRFKATFTRKMARIILLGGTKIQILYRGVNARNK